MKNIDTLVEDIYRLFELGHLSSKTNTTILGETIANVVNSRLSDYKEVKAPYLRLSMTGKPDRQIYYELKNYYKEPLSPQTKIKFLFGDILEALLLFLAEESGHTVTEKQAKVTVNGVVGSKDAKIDGMTVDVKSASSYSFKKFESGNILFDDPFGYVSQLSGYSNEGGAFLAIDKQNGNICLTKVPAELVVDVPARIDNIREMLSKDAPPERCYEEEPEGKSGNMKLSIGCSYCPFKFECWKESNEGKGLRVFAYSTGVKFMTKIVKEPKVEEKN